MSSLSTSLKNSYQRWLHPYEEYLRTAKPGVQQQLEYEHGGPYTPSPAHSPVKNSFPHQNTPAAIAAETPVIQASAALSASLGPNETMLQPSTVVPVEAPRSFPSSGFTAVNTGGFAAVNAPSGFVAVNNTPPLFVKRESDGTVPSPGPNFHPRPQFFTSTSNFVHGSPGKNPMTNGNGIGSNPLKRTLSHESLNGESGSDGANGDGDSGSGRRSKRLKKGT